jgi:hypothetical protein
MLSFKWLLPVAALALQAQTPAPPPQPPAGFQVEMADRSVRTIDYREVKSSTKIDFKGTNLAPKASGGRSFGPDHRLPGSEVLHQDRLQGHQPGPQGLGQRRDFPR